MTESWVPLISRSSDEGHRAWQAICALAEAPVAEARWQRHANSELALLEAYLFLADGNHQWMQRAVRHLNAAIADVDALCSSGRWGLHGGLAGLGWIVEHVSRIHSGAPAASPAYDLNSDTDAVLLRELNRGRWRGSCDLESGLTGIGIYFLERLPARRASHGVALVIAHMESMWRECGPEPGMTHFMADAFAAGIEKKTAARLLDESIALFIRESTPSYSPVAAAVFLDVARLTDRADCRELGRKLLAGDHNSLSTDSPAIVAHALNRIHQREGDPQCREMARVILSREGHTLRLGMTPLVLLSALTPIEPAWDRRIALSSLDGGAPTSPSAVTEEKVCR